MEERAKNLQTIIKNILLTTEEQIQGDLSNSIRLRMSLCENLQGDVRFLKCLKVLAEERLERFFVEKVFPKNYEEFIEIWSILVKEARSSCNDSRYDYEEERYKYEFVYYEIYCNVYLKYSLGLLFNGRNNETIEELLSYNSIEIIHMYRYYLHRITLNKLQKALQKEKVKN